MLGRVTRVTKSVVWLHLSGARRGPTEAPRVGLFGLLGSGNIGNDGSLEVVRCYLRECHPDAVLDALCTGPQEILRRFGIDSTHLYWNREENRTASSATKVCRKVLGKLIDAFRVAIWVRKHDVVIVPGMGVLEATLPLRPWATPYSLFLLCSFGKLFGVKIALVSVGANVANALLTRVLLLAAARRAYYLSYRDTQSQSAMRLLGLRERNDRVYPDLVFALATPEPSTGMTGYVGLGVMDYRGGNDDRHRADELHRSYVAAMKRLVRLLIDEGRSVRLLTGDAVDRRVVDAILADIGEYRPGLAPARVLAEPVESLSALMMQIATVDTVIGIRFHNIVCALKLAKPTVALGYAEKQRQLMASMGLERFCQDVDTLDFERLIDQLHEAERRRVELVRTIEASVQSNKRQLDEQFKILSRTLFSEGSHDIPLVGQQSEVRRGE